MSVTINYSVAGGGGGSSGGGAVSSVAGKTGAVTLASTDLTNGSTLENIPINWDGTTPALVSSTNPIPAFGSNAFIYTGTGGATLDGSTFQTGDLALWNGTVFTKIVLGGGYLGSFGSTGALQSAYPAASNTSCDALVSGVLYKSDGTSWKIKVQATTDLSDATVLNQQSTNAQTGTTYTLVIGDAGQNVDMNNASVNTLTIPPNSSVAFPIGTLVTVTMTGAGITSIAAGGGVTIVKPAGRSLAISAQYETAQLYKVATDTWRVLAG